MRVFGKPENGFLNPKTNFAFFRRNPKKVLWIQNIQTRGGYSGSNLHADFSDSWSKRFFFLGKDSQKVYLASFFPVISLLERIARNSELKEGSAPHVFPPTLSEITNPFSDSPIKNTPLARERDCHLTIWSTYRNRMQIIPRALTSSSDISPVVCCFVADVNQICENEKRTCGACRPLKSLLFTH